MIESKSGDPTLLTGKYSYAIMSSRFRQDELYPDANPIFTVSRDGAILAVVKHLTRFSSP